MSDTEVVDAEVVRDEPEPERAPEPVMTTALVAPSAAAPSVAPQVSADDLVKRMAVIKEVMDRTMIKGVDYGVIPGTGTKPTLLKPGAEKLAVEFELDIQPVNEQSWGPGDHLTVTSRATVYHAPTGARLGYGEGLCTTREKKYGKRQQARACPHCGLAAIIKGKEEYGGGWVCFKKKDGCGAKFPDGDERIEGQQVGEIDNPDIPDMWNTVLKMASKRARIDAVLAVTGASALFTQDLDDTAAAAQPQEPSGPPFGEALPDAHQQRVGQAIHTLLLDPETGVVPDVAGVADRIIQDAGGYFPRIVARALLHLEKALTAPTPAATGDES